VETNVIKQAGHIWTKAIAIYPRLIQFPQPTIKLNNRYTKTAGMCYMERNHIELGTKFFARNYDAMMEIILPHELAHQIDFNLNGIPKGNRWHGKSWQQIMLNLGTEPSTYHNMVI
jgi:predicted SprT family Zn-dependent metalloprotease